MAPLNLKKMYPPQKDSPSTYIAGDIGVDDTHILVGSAEILPQTVPFPLTLGFDRSVTETVTVTDLGTGGNNQLTVIRGPQPLVWTAGTKCARVFTSGDMTAIQENIGIIGEQTDKNTTDIGKNTTDIGKNTTDIGKNTTDISAEVTRAKAAETAEETRAKAAEQANATAITNETTRAQGYENNLQTNKVNRTELTVIMTDAQFTADGTTAKATFTTYDASAQVVSSIERYIPMVSSAAVGVMTPEAYNEMIQLRTDVNALQQQGGRFIGRSFATKAALDAYTVPGSVKRDDYTYVLDDETKDGATTEYIYSGSGVWAFAYIIESDPIGLANATTPGLVKSDIGTTAGKIFVELDGTMSLIGWNSILTDISNSLTKTGDASNVTNTFTQAATRVNLTTGEKLNISLGKIMKWFTDLKTVAWTGLFSDIQSKPTTRSGYGIIDAAPLQTTSATAPVATSWNDIISPGSYNFLMSGTGNPDGPGISGYFYVDVYQFAGTNVTQVAYPYQVVGPAKNGVYTRNRYDGNWSIWRLLPYADSPEFTGVPSAPTPATGTNSAQIANCFFVNNEIAQDAITKTNGGIASGGIIANPSTGVQIGANSYAQLSSGGNAMAVFGENSYIDGVANVMKYVNTHVTVGAQGIALQWGMHRPKYYDNVGSGAVAGATFSPNWYEILTTQDIDKVETGTWVPQFPVCFTNVLRNQAIYYKIGKMVIVQFYGGASRNLADTSVDSASFTITGLPYSTNGYHSLVLSYNTLEAAYQSNFGTSSVTQCQLMATGTQILLATGSAGYVTNGQLKTNISLIFSGVYQTI